MTTLVRPWAALEKLIIMHFGERRAANPGEGQTWPSINTLLWSCRDWGDIYSVVRGPNISSIFWRIRKFANRLNKNICNISACVSQESEAGSVNI